MLLHRLNPLLYRISRKITSALCLPATRCGQPAAGAKRRHSQYHYGNTGVGVHQFPVVAQQRKTTQQRPHRPRFRSSIARNEVSYLSGAAQLVEDLSAFLSDNPALPTRSVAMDHDEDADSFLAGSIDLHCKTPQSGIKAWSTVLQIDGLALKSNPPPALDRVLPAAAEAAFQAVLGDFVAAHFTDRHRPSTAS